MGGRSFCKVVMKMADDRMVFQTRCLEAGCEKKDLQRIMVFQQRGRAESKIAGIREYGGGLFLLDVVSIKDDLPPVIEDCRSFFPKEIRADLVLDYLIHPDLSQDLAGICREKNIPIVASGKKTG